MYRQLLHLQAPDGQPRSVATLLQVVESVPKALRQLVSAKQTEEAVAHLQAPLPAARLTDVKAEQVTESVASEQILGIVMLGLA